jgi:hypothetical protein
MEALCYLGLLHTNVAYCGTWRNRIGDDGCAALSKGLLLPDFKLRKLFLGGKWTSWSDSFGSGFEKQ